jgi:hypothetical protein
VASIIPFTPGDPDQFIEIQLDDEQYVLRARWNASDDDNAGAWYLDAWERDGKTPIAFGVKLVLGVMLGRSYNHPLFIGGLFLLDETDRGVGAGLFDLGGRCNLVHLTTADAVLMGTKPL